MRKNPAPATSPLLTKDFLAFPSKGRPAYLLGHPVFPRPVTATLDKHGLLTWQWYPESEETGERHTSRPAGLQKPAPDLCFRFAQLALGSDEQIRAFAQRWGPLGIGPRPNEEYLDDWRRYAELTAALFRFTAEQASGGRGRDEDWSTICQSSAAKQIDRAHMSVAQQRAITALVVNACFAAARGHRILELVDR